ncbi:MAG: hypothetical protein LBP62_01430 [Clostridiales bacterium]|nr:hypothetical protein [Clostridiales bacterium]
MPKVYVFLAYEKEVLRVGFKVRECGAAQSEIKYEKDGEPVHKDGAAEMFLKPFGEIKYRKDGEPVYKDSAVEMFFKPFDGDARYLNFEFNAEGFGILGFGEGKTDRKELIHKYKKDLSVRVVSPRKEPVENGECKASGKEPVENGERKAGGEIERSAFVWELYFDIPFKMISEIYGADFRVYKGRRVRANFYKCGDETPLPHYGAAFQVESPFPEFHLPEFFGTLIFD